MLVENLERGVVGKQDLAAFIQNEDAHDTVLDDRPVFLFAGADLLFAQRGHLGQRIPALANGAQHHDQHRGQGNPCDQRKQRGATGEQRLEQGGAFILDGPGPPEEFGGIDLTILTRRMFVILTCIDQSLGVGRVAVKDVEIIHIVLVRRQILQQVAADERRIDPAAKRPLARAGGIEQRPQQQEPRFLHRVLHQQDARCQLRGVGFSRPIRRLAPPFFKADVQPDGFLVGQHGRDIFDHIFLVMVRFWPDLEPRRPIGTHIADESILVHLGHGLDKPDAVDAGQVVFEIQTFDKGLEIVVFDILRRLHHPGGAVQTLQIDVHPTIQRLKPVLGDAGEFGLCRGAVHSRAFSVDPEGHEKADNDQNQI